LKNLLTQVTQRRIGAWSKEKETSKSKGVENPPSNRRPSTHLPQGILKNEKETARRIQTN